MTWTTDEFTGTQFGKYEVLCRLAVGGMAEIFLGFARFGPFLGRPVVLKRILREQREDPAALQMLIDEAKLTATLSHPNVAQVLDLEMVRDDVVLVIEFIAGANAEEMVSACQIRSEPVPLGFALAATREAAQGLAHAHSHKDAKGQVVPIIHRDVTPRNVMVGFDGAVKMLDFGIARAKGSARRTQVGMVRGTTAYMSPEQAIGKEVDHRSDLFSLGVVAYELLTGQRLFYRGNPTDEMAAVYEAAIEPPSRVNRRVPRAVDPVVMRALERKVERRYQSAQEFIHDLSQAAGGALWTRERCSEMVRGQFTTRQREIEKLVSRIPNWNAMADSLRTLVGRGGPAPVTADEPIPKTVVALDPLAQARSTGEPVKAKEPRFGDAVPTESGAAVVAPHESPTDPRGPAVSRRRGTSTLIVSALAALLVGGAGGGLVFTWVNRPNPLALSRVTIDADRPAEVLLHGQVLGRTPLLVVFPVGRHELHLREPEGPDRQFELYVVPDIENRVTVSLDTLEPAGP